MRRVLGTALCAGLFVLLLSALVVAAPQEGEPPRRAEPPAMPVETAIAALVPVDARQAAQAAAGAQDTGAARPAALPAQAPLPAGPDGGRDANGRVLTAARYAASVYQVFRAEAAGG